MVGGIDEGERDDGRRVDGEKRKEQKGKIKSGWKGEGRKNYACASLPPHTQMITFFESGNNVREIVANADLHDVLFLFGSSFAVEESRQALVKMLLLRHVSFPVVHREMVRF